MFVARSARGSEASSLNMRVKSLVRLESVLPKYGGTLLPKSVRSLTANVFPLKNVERVQPFDG